ncbi:MAG: phosphatase PAP2 family protein [Betaproteobacteria bacterium]|nr:phosphatase PAP2 family protein [Betaproteobacteria bacterium]
MTNPKPVDVPSQNRAASLNQGEQAKRLRAIERLYAFELSLIWLFGSVAAWAGNDRVLQASSLAGALVLLAAWRSLRATASDNWAAWRGVLLFAASWLLFPLLKAIRASWITQTYDGSLLLLDRTLWGGLSLPEHAFALEHFWLSEVLSAAYLSFYFVVLLPVIYFAWKRTSREAQVFLFGLNAMYMIGFISYLIMPAGGPYIAYPELFPYPVYGGPLTDFLAQFVALSATGMDAFPSLHSGVAVYVWSFFLFGGYRRTTLALTPFVLSIVIASVYLRHNYGVDLIAGILLALGVQWAVKFLRETKS